MLYRRSSTHTHTHKRALLLLNFGDNIMLGPFLAPQHFLFNNPFLECCSYCMCWYARNRSSTAVVAFTGLPTFVRYLQSYRGYQGGAEGSAAASYNSNPNQMSEIQLDVASADVEQK